jgi:hypothetical protein
MSARYYGLLLGVAASLSLLTAGCGGADRTRQAMDPVTGRMPSVPTAQQAAKRDPDNTDATLWTVLGLARRQSEREIGPQTGEAVSPVLWVAARETLDFAGTASEDPMTGLLVTNWYSPAAKPNEQLRVSVFILSRALRSDSVTVTVERQVRSPGGPWSDAPVSRDVVTGLETAILLRARQIHAERYRSSVYN